MDNLDFRSTISLASINTCRAVCSESRLLTRHNQESAQWSPDLSPRERAGSRHKIIYVLQHPFHVFSSTRAMSAITKQFHFRSVNVIPIFRYSVFYILQGPHMKTGILCCTA